MVAALVLMLSAGVPGPEGVARSRPDVERAVARGLAWLAREQGPHGEWTGDVGHKQQDDYVVYFPAERQRHEGRGHVGVSAIAGMAFLAGGHVPKRGEYGLLVQRTVEYLLGAVKEDGYITDSEDRMYSHAFATLFLAEVYGMERNRELKEKLEMAVDLIVKCQNDQGGWRYSPFVRDADLSVSVCQVQALRAARNVGIRVPRANVDRAIEYVKHSRIQGGRESGAFYYKVEGRSARTKTSFTINAAAVTALMSAGFYDYSWLEPAIRYIEETYDDVSRVYGDHFYFWYGNYYASQALFQVGGARFDRYYTRLVEDLLSRQEHDGAWPNSVGPGRAFSTAVACILLQIPNQYLPIFQR
jgi:hypothetical protein